MTAVLYATREEIKAELDLKETARSNRRIDRALDDASRSVEELCHRIFYPIKATRYFDWPDSQSPRPWRLWLNDSEVLSLDTLVAGGVTIPESDYNLEPNRTGPPYNRIEVDLSTSSSFDAGDTWQQSIAATGLWAGCPLVETAVGATAGALTASQTTLGVDGPASAELGVGSLLRVDSERMLVAGRTQASTGQTLAADLDGLSNAVAVTVASTAGFAEGETITIDAERMRVDDVTATTITVTRAWDGSVLAAHTSGATLYAPRTLTVVRGALGTTAATHDTAAAVQRWDPPGSVRQLTVAEALTDLMQGRSGYARTAGSGDNEREMSGRGLTDLRKRVYASHARKARIRGV